MSFITNGGCYEWILTQFESPNTITYGQENFSEGSLTSAVFDKLSIGNVISKQLNLKLWNPSGFDPRTEFKLFLRKYQGERKPEDLIETIPMGTFFCDSFEISPYSEFADIVAYDPLLKAEVPFMETGSFEETTDKAIVEEIATAIGVNIEANTASILANTMIINELPNVGDNGTTMREMLSVVAVMRGGNFIINNDNELELVSLLGKYDVARLVTIDSNGDFELVPFGLIDSSNDVVTVDANGDFQVILFSSVTDSTELWYVDGDGNDYIDTWANIQTLAPIPNPAVTIGNEVVDFDVSPQETIKGVELWSGASMHYRAWNTNDYADWEDIDGAILYAQMPIMASQDLADALFAQYEDFKYVPYTSRGVYADPELPLGTILEIKDNTVANNDPVVLTNRIQNIDLLAACELSADATLQAVAYYPYLSPVERQLQEEVKENYTRISANDEAITQEAQRAQGVEEDIRSVVKQTAEDITQTFTDFVNNQSTYIRYSAAGIEIGKSGEPFMAKLGNTKLAFTGEDGKDAAWISNSQLNINEAVIEKDTKFLGSAGNWVQQVVNDHFQIKWVVNSN